MAVAGITTVQSNAVDKTNSFYVNWSSESLDRVTKTQLFVGAGLIFFGAVTAVIGSIPFAASMILVGIGSVAAIDALYKGIIGNTCVGSNVRAERVVDLSPYDNIDSVDYHSCGHLEITQGDKNTLRISADENLLDCLTHDVRKGELVLGTSQKSFSTKNPISYHLTLTNPERVRASGVGKVHIRELNLPEFTCHHTGCGSVEVSGHAAKQTVVHTGVGTYNAENLRTEHTNAELDGVGSVYVHAAETLDVSIKGIGNCYYSGNPRVKCRNTGIGRLHQA